jgi:hypothetical protein
VDAADPPIAAADAEAGLEASLDELSDYGGSARERITVAYRRLLAALAAAGAPRLPHEAPYEHLHRALGPLEVSPGPMHRLAELYVLAHFSEHPITEQHRAEAAAVLEHALTSLRAAGRAAAPAVKNAPA